MGGDGAEVVRLLQNSSDVKVHNAMCWELTNILDRIISVLPAIESARPGASGIQELCSLNNSIEKAKLILQHCAESSKLYLAITREATLLRCERIRSLMDQSLCRIQNMVPPLLATQITEVLNCVRDAKFIIDSSEEEAGKAMLELLQQTDSNEELEVEAFQTAASKLNITSPKSLLIERRSIKKLLDKLHGTDPKKEKILKYLLHLLKKHGNKLRPSIIEDQENASSQGKSLIGSTNSAYKTGYFENNDKHVESVEVQTDSYGTAVPPEEYCCPISSRLMCDPVVIASGLTYDRIWIEKWFDEGHDTCPKTQKKLENLSMTPNFCMKDLISNWCRKHGVNVEDPFFQPNPSAFRSFEPLHYNSISSLRNVSSALLDGNTGDFIFQSDHSTVSLVSSDASSCSDSSHVKGIEKSTANCSHLFSWSDDYQKYQTFANFDHDMFMRFFQAQSQLPLDHQGKAMEDVRTLLECDEETCYAMLANGFAETLLRFMKNAYKLSDVQAQKTGAQLFLAFLSNSRVEIPSLSEDAFQLLTSFLDSEIITEALMILQKLSQYPHCKSNFVASGVAPSIIKFLDSEDAECLELALKILCDLSSQNEMKSHILSSGCMSKMVPLLSNGRLAGYCLMIMRSLSDSVEGAMLIAETDGCVASIVELLDTGSLEDQEHSVAILYAVCSHSIENCLLVMKEGVIPALVDISVNGNAKGKESSQNLLHLLRDLRQKNCFDDPCSESGSLKKISEPAEHFIDPSADRPVSKSSRFFGSFLSKPRSLALF